MKKLSFAVLSCLFMLCWQQGASAHFGAIIPSADILQQGDSGKIKLNISFLHPMEQQYLEMVTPKRFGVSHGSIVEELTATLRPSKQGGALAWETEFQIKRPGDYVFFLEPEPYWETAEDVFIIHYTKVIVNGFGLEQGWDQPIQLKTEIMPLTRPYGLWAGNLFTGVVLRDGKPIPYAEIEVEYFNGNDNPSSRLTATAGPFITQVLKADSNGVFSYAMPKAGWWGFAALSEADYTIQHNGAEKGVELGAVIWVHARDME